MEVEICTITSTWVTNVDDQEFADRAPGSAAVSVRTRINAGEPIEVKPDAGGPPHARAQQMAIFNPGHVVAVVERSLRRARW